MKVDFQTDILLAPYTTLKIGGLARHFVVVKTEEELVEACNWAKEKSQKIFILGGGSNVVISDAGFNGLVILIDIKGCIFEHGESRPEIIAGVKAGVIWDNFVLESVSKRYTGIECLSGIPGKVGGSVVQNIGAYGQEISELVEKVRFYDVEKKDFGEYSNTECQFSYRQSVFKGDFSKIVVSVHFKLKRDPESVIKYKELVEKFGDTKPALAQVRETVLDLRKSKSMLVDAGDQNSVSAGSFFKNPVINQGDFEKIKENYPDVPNWVQKDDTIKLSAGWLIEKSGLPKGFIYKDGKVGLSQKHALAIINRGSARASDVYEFSEFIKKSVFDTFGVKLQLEVVFIGF